MPCGVDTVGVRCECVYMSFVLTWFRARLCVPGPLARTAVPRRHSRIPRGPRARRVRRRAVPGRAERTYLLVASPGCHRAVELSRLRRGAVEALSSRLSRRCRGAVEALPVEPVEPVELLSSSCVEAVEADCRCLGVELSCRVAVEFLCRGCRVYIHCRVCCRARA